MIAAGVNAKALSAFMGHSSIKVTFDLYGHLMPGTEAEAASLLDAFLAVESEQAAELARARRDSRGCRGSAEQLGPSAPGIDVCGVGRPNGPHAACRYC